MIALPRNQTAGSAMVPLNDLLSIIWTPCKGERRRPRRGEPGTISDWFDLLLMAATVNILERPIERIRETCEMMDAADKFDRALPELETYLEEEIAAGEISEARLTYDGLCFLRQVFSRR
jgi:hypothetical protein